MEEESQGSVGKPLWWNTVFEPRGRTVAGHTSVNTAVPVFLGATLHFRLDVFMCV